MSLARLRSWIVTPPLALATFLMFAATDRMLALSAATRRHQHNAARFWSRMLLRFSGIRWEIIGLEKIPVGLPCVFAVNHLSLADTPVLMALLPVSFRFLAKESLWKVPIIGGHLRRGGHIAVKRDQARQAARSLVEAARMVRDRGLSVLVFAEGTRSTGQLQSFKSGAAHIAIHAEAPLVPLALSGTPDVLPKGARMLRPAKVLLRIGEPIRTVGLGAQDRDRITDQLRERVSALLGEIMHRSS